MRASHCYSAGRGGLLVAAGLLAAAACLLPAAGCSCRKAEPAHTVTVQQPAQAQQPAAGQPAPGAQPAAGGQAEAAKPAPPRPYATGPAAPGVGESVLRAPGDYASTVVVTAPRYMKKTIAVSNLENQIKMYQASEGHWPASLDDFAKWAGELPPPPPGGKYLYDPTTGALDVVAAD